MLYTDETRRDILSRLSGYRLKHTLGCEKAARMLAQKYGADEDKCAFAMLLHDITKELSTEEQVLLCHAYGIPVDGGDLLAPKTLHARTAAAQIPVEYPAFDDPLIVSAVRWHTTGHADMTLTEKLLYLADYIDASRTFQNCVILRRYFWGAGPEGMTDAERAALLRDTLLLSYDMTIRDLLDEGTPVAVDTVEARNELLRER